MFCKSPETIRAPWAHLRRGALHFTEGERQWIRGVFLYPFAGADTAGILLAHVAQQSCTWGALCMLSLTTKDSFICIWDEGWAPQSAFPDLWQEETHGIFWCQGREARKILCNQYSSYLLFSKDSNIFGIWAPIQFKGHCICVCSQKWHGIRGHPGNRHGKSYSKK